jgi:hypothetical protein
MSKVYYGEYSLKHWIDLILNGNIQLPEYQRSFVWEEEDVQRLIKSLVSDQFVPPVTIAHYNQGSKSTNLILDGQQRLTAILLAYLGFFPDKSKFESCQDLLSDDDSNERDLINGNSMQEPKYIKWTFNELVEDKPDVYKLKKELLENEKYNRLIIKSFVDLSEEGKEDIYDGRFLGFSFIVPSENDDVRSTFSKIFRDINYQGKQLSPLESRKALYFLQTEYINFFEGIVVGSKRDVLCDIGIMDGVQKSKLDLLRYLSILSQYLALENTNNSGRVMIGYSSYRSRENFYADYVSYIVGEEQSSRVDKFNGFDFKETFPDNCWKESFVNLQRTILEFARYFDLVDKYHAFQSWIDADYWLFGIIYWIVFKNRTINIENDLVDKVKKKIFEKRNDKSYSTQPNRLGNLRDRLAWSINLFGEYVSKNS